MPPRLRSKAVKAEQTPPLPPDESTARPVEKPDVVQKQQQQQQQQRQPPPPPARALAVSARTSLAQQAFASTAHLANLLPTGTLLAFQMLTPVFSGNGKCDGVTRTLTQLLLLVLALTALLACFTDSFRTSTGRLVYGFATRRGMWMFDARGVEEAGEVPADLSKYRLRAVDFIHAFMSVLVFGSVAMRDKNVVGCLYPHPDKEVRQVLNIVPLGVGFFCGMMFVIFPTRRHGIGYPITDAT